MNHPPTASVGFLSKMAVPFVGDVLTIHQLRWWYSKLHKYRDSTFTRPDVDRLLPYRTFTGKTLK